MDRRQQKRGSPRESPPAGLNRTTQNPTARAGAAGGSPAGKGQSSPTKEIQGILGYLGAQRKTG